MRKAALAGALMLAIAGPVSVSAQSLDASSARMHATQNVSAGEVDTKIMYAKAALRLTPEQERHWPRVAAALRDVVYSRSASADTGSLTHRIKARAGEFVFSTAAINRLIAAARPLIRTLDEGQKRSARQMARAMGLDHLASRFE